MDPENDSLENTIEDTIDSLVGERQRVMRESHRSYTTFSQSYLNNRERARLEEVSPIPTTGSNQEVRPLEDNPFTYRNTLSEAPLETNNNTMDDDVKTVIKKRHLSRDERRMLHKPESDWSESNNGDVCKSACSLEVKDLLVKHNV